jgi:hypothetical protein
VACDSRRVRGRLLGSLRHCVGCRAWVSTTSIGSDASSTGGEYGDDLHCGVANNADIITNADFISNIASNANDNYAGFSPRGRAR